MGGSYLLIKHNTFSSSKIGHEMSEWRANRAQGHACTARAASGGSIPPTAKDAIGEETSRRATSDDRRVSSGMAGDHGHTVVETLERSQTVESGT